MERVKQCCAWMYLERCHLMPIDNNQRVVPDFHMVCLFTVESHFTVTAVAQPSRHYGHPGQSQIISVTVKYRTLIPL